MKKQYLIIGVVSILILTVSVSLGYWMAYIEGNGAPIDLTAQDLKITFDSNGNIEPGYIEPGWTYRKTFTVTSETNEIYYYKIIIKDLVNTFKTDYLKYKITSSHGYNMDGFEVLPKTEKATDTDISDKIKIEPSEVQEYTIEFIYETTTADQSEDMGATLGGTLYIGEWVEKGILAKALFTTKYTEEELSKKREDFSKIVSEGSVYYEDKNWTEDVTKDNVGEKVYYFAGNAQDNWVQFGQDSTGKNLYWRIIRSNEDGGLRLLYAGTSPDTTEAYISAMAYNTSYDNTTYVGYMYSVGSTTLSAIRGNSTNSSIKAELDTWYATNLQSYDKYISKTAIYCNDRSNDNWSSSSTMYYGAAQRLTIQASSNKGASQSSQYHPSFKCGNTYEGKLHTDSESDTERKKDMFSYSTLSGGNGLLSKSVGGVQGKPIGLITADEISYAGGVYDTNNPNAYYYRNSKSGSGTDVSAVGSKYWWTMSPYIFDKGYARMFYVRGSGLAGELYNDYVGYSSNVVRPVISLKGCVKMNGNGKSDDPYTVLDMEDASECALAEN